MPFEGYMPLAGIPLGIGEAKAQVPAPSSSGTLYIWFLKHPLLDPFPFYQKKWWLLSRYRLSRWRLSRWRLSRWRLSRWRLSRCHLSTVPTIVGDFGCTPCLLVCTVLGARHYFWCTPRFLVCTILGARHQQWCTPRFLVYTKNGVHHY